MKSKSAYKIISLVLILLLILVSAMAIFIDNLMAGNREADLTINMGVGQQYQYPSDSSHIKYYSYDKELVSVDSNGVITAHGKGTARIAVGRKQIDVNVYDAPESIVLNEASFSLGVGEEYQLVAKIPNSELDSGYEYKISGDCAKIDENGKVVGIKAGKATVTVSTYNDCTAKCDIKVGKPPEKIKLSASSKTLYLGINGKLYVNIASDCASKEIIIESDNEDVLMVNSKCELIPVATGKAKIKATAFNGVSDECEFTIEERPFYIRSELNPDKPMIAFTFDDGPNYKTTNKILNTFIKNNSSCTFFIVANRINSDETKSCIKRMVENGFQLGNHTYSHEHYGSDVTIEDITKCADKLNSITGHGPTAFRPTGGFLSDVIKENCGAPIILWNIDTEDWKLRDADKIYNKLLNEARDGGIVIMHDIYPSTADAIEKVIPKLIENGYQIVNVAELAYYRGKTLENGKTYYSF